MLLLDELPVTSTAEEAATIMPFLAPRLGITAALPDVRTLRLWRSKKYLTIDGRRFTRRNLLEVFVIVKLRQKGHTFGSAVTLALKNPEDRLLHLLTEEANQPAPQVDAEPIITLRLLARGILEQYRRVRQGAIVGHIDVQRSGVGDTPIALHQAMARLGRHYFTEGREDQAAGVHQLLRLCMGPLTHWAPQALAELEGHQNTVLIDPVYLVPNEDCEAIAEEGGGFRLEDLVEHYLHEELRARVQALGSGADNAYTLLREFIGRHPLVTLGELQGLYFNPELNDQAIRFLHEIVYVPVHTAEAESGRVRRCAFCQGLITKDGLCSLVGCRIEHPTTTALEVAVEEAWCARPEVRKYWCDPAREELRLYDALRHDGRLMGRVHLYPHGDRCDVSLDDEMGIDVKDYESPLRLAQRLNHSLGGLSHYPERVLAIATRRWTPLYRERLREQLRPDRRSAIQIMSVREAIAHLKKRGNSSLFEVSKYV